MCYLDDATRVKLDDRDDGESNYINANYISVSVMKTLMYVMYIRIICIYLIAKLGLHFILFGHII